MRHLCDQADIIFRINQISLQLLATIKSCGMEVKLIDDPSLVSQAMKKLSPTATIEDLKCAKRDRIMAIKIISESEKKNGGIIHLSGAFHSTLLELLTQDSARPTIAALIFNTKEDTNLNAYCPIELWTKLSDRKFRKSFYKKEVLYCTENTSFDDFVQKAGINPAEMSEPPYLGKLFNSATGFNFNYSIDDEGILSATLTLPDSKQLPQVKAALNAAIPKLPTFFERRNGCTELVLRGINDSEEVRSFLYPGNKI